MSAPKLVELYYDVVSPFTWIGFELLCRYRNRWNIQVKLKPFFAGGVMKATDNKPPGFVPAKAVYMTKDVERLAKHYSVPLVQPSDPGQSIFGAAGLPAMRFLTAVDMERPDLTERLSRELWFRIWHRDQDIKSPASLSEAACAVGLSAADAERFVAAMTSPATKDRLKAYTDMAVEAGAFGSPTFVLHVDGEAHTVFGSDRFNIMADLLGEKYEGPLAEYNQAKL